MDYKQYELSYDQVDQIVINELKEVIVLNWNGDHEIVAAAFTLLAYYMPAIDFQLFKDEIKINPPRDSTYENTN